MTAWLGIHLGPENTASRGWKTAAGVAVTPSSIGLWILLTGAHSSSGRSFITLRTPCKCKREPFLTPTPPIPFDLAGEGEHTASDTEELNHIFFFFPPSPFPRCTELNLIRCYITSVRGCMANLIKKKQCVSPSLADSFTSWHLWEKTPLRHILQPL